MQKKHKIGFFTPNCRIKEEFFGAATFGLAHQMFGEVYSNQSVFFPDEIEGVKLAGKYEDVLNDTVAVARANNVCAAIVLFGNAGGENDFIDRLNRLLSCPIVGGGAAMNLETSETGLLDKVGAQVSVLLITDSRYRIEVSCKNIHSQVISEHRLSFTDKRVLDKIDAVEAAAWLHGRKTDLGFDSDDFEHITFATKDGINAHLSYVGGKIKSGRDLDEIMDLRIVHQTDVLPQMKAFYQDNNAIVFGCAGLRGILPERFSTDAIGLFMFGEVCYANGKADFGNLMLSKIKFVKK